MRYRGHIWTIRDQLITTGGRGVSEVEQRELWSNVASVANSHPEPGQEVELDFAREWVEFYDPDNPST